MAWIEDRDVCACGFEGYRADDMAMARRRWGRIRNGLAGIGLGGIVVMNVAQTLGLGGLGIAGALISALAIFAAGGAIVRTRMIDRQLREARKPKPLPEARIV